MSQASTIRLLGTVQYESQNKSRRVCVCVCVCVCVRARVRVCVYGTLAVILCMSHTIH